MDYFKTLTPSRGPLWPAAIPTHIFGVLGILLTVCEAVQEVDQPDAGKAQGGVSDGSPT